MGEDHGEKGFGKKDKRRLKIMGIPVQGRGNIFGQTKLLFRYSGHFFLHRRPFYPDT